MALSAEQFERNACEAGVEPMFEALLKHQKRSRQALHCTDLKESLGCSYRALSRRLAECALPVHEIEGSSLRPAHLDIALELQMV